MWLQLIFLKNLVSTLRWISRSRRARSGASATCYLHYHALMSIVHDICGRNWRWLLLDTVNRSWWSSGLYTTTNICRLAMSTHQIIVICKISYFTIPCQRRLRSTKENRYEFAKESLYSDDTWKRFVGGLNIIISIILIIIILFQTLVCRGSVWAVSSWTTSSIHSTITRLRSCTSYWSWSSYRGAAPKVDWIVENRKWLLKWLLD